MTPFLPSDSSVVVVAGRQSSGVGRGANAWLSPPGCAAFTLHLPSLSLHDSALGRRVSILQHLVALAVVEAAVGRSGYEGVDARIKWPNDLLHGESRAKLGGVLVKSSIMGKHVRCVVGCGVNLSNGKPTTCLNDLASAAAVKDGVEANLMSTEEFIARVVTRLDRIMTDFEDSERREAILKRYYDRWLHGEQRVTVKYEESVSSSVEATVVGIDEYGFLKALADDGRELTLHPDGNSFDLFSNLIVSK